MKQKKRHKTIQRSVLSGAILGVLGTAQAATINVDGGCTLIDAIQAANTDLPVGSCTAGSGADVIQVVTADSAIDITTIFEPSPIAPGDVGLPVISSEITIEGNGLNLTADNSIDDFRVFDVFYSGDLTLRDTTVSNADDGNGVGSGLFSAGRVTLENTTFHGNNGAVFLYGGFGNEISNSVFRHNTNDAPYAAAIQTYFSQLSINDTSVFGNQHDYNAARGGIPTIAGGLGLMQSEVSITNSTISGNKGVYGAGLFVESDNPMPLPSKSARFGNSPLRGVIQSEVTITNSTITNNQAVIAAGLLQYGYDSKVTLQGSILAGNVNRADGYAPEGYLFNESLFYAGNYNIIGHNGDPGFNGLVLSGNDQSFADDAADNLFRLTQTNGQFMHPLRVDSVAIDGNDLSCFGSIFDQEGKARGIDGDDDGSFICDIGSFEHSLPIMATVSGPCTLSDAIQSANADASVNGCQPGNGHDVIMLPPGSTINLTQIESVYPINPSLVFGLPSIDTGISIEGNGSTIQRDPGAVDVFDLMQVGRDGHLNLHDSTLTGAPGILSAVLGVYAGMNVVDSTFTGNQSAAIVDVYSVNSSVVGTQVSGNDLYGGYTANYAPLTIRLNTGFELHNTTISNNTSGGTFAGAAIQNRMTVIENSTISGNTAGVVGGLFINDYGISSILRHSTITGNEGGTVGGVYAQASAPGIMRFEQNIISGNTYVAPPPTPRVTIQPVLAGTPTIPILGGGSQPDEINSNPNLEITAPNVIGQNGDAGTVGAVVGPSVIVPVGPTSTVIDPLADNGGTTLTHMPVAGGPAVDTGSPICLPQTDQLDRIRPWDGDSSGSAQCDMGAVEFGSVTASDLIFKDGFDPVIIIRRSLRD